jgi:acetyl-CoA/propionyl-CoA carboxylase biotin carboxyl carrier protein
VSPAAGDALAQPVGHRLAWALEAMKMEQPINAYKAGTVRGISASVGEVVTAGAVLCEIQD